MRQVIGDFDDMSTQAARVFYKLVRDFALNTKTWDSAIYHDVMPDERLDPTLIAARIYGRRCEFLTVLAAAGVNSVDQPLKQSRLVLPTEGVLLQMKRRAGFESRPEYIKADGSPTWAAR